MKKNRNILVTGGTGFIGSHLCEFLVQKGFNVTAYDQYNINNSWNWLENSKFKKDIKVVLGDIRDAENVNKYIKKNEIVFHLAALIGIPYSFESPSSYVDTNINGTLNILNSCRKNSISDLIITSTSEVYGNASKKKIDENHKLSALSPYAASKISQDQLALSYFNSFEMPIKIIRPFNVFGPRQSSRAIIPTIIGQIINKNSKITVGNTHPIRDFTYVLDTCEAFLSVLMNNRLYGEVVNAGNQKSIRIKDLIKMIQKIMGSNLKVHTKRNRIRKGKSEVNYLHSNSKKIYKFTGWKPKISLEEGLIETIEWIDSNINNYKTNIYNV